MEPTPVAAAMATLESAIAALQGAIRGDAFRSLDGEVAELVERAHRCEAGLKAGTLGLVAEFAERQIAEDVGDVTPRAWIRGKLRETVGASGATAKMAAVCTAKGPYPEIGAGLGDGSLNWDQARSIATSLEKLPTKTTLEQREFARDLLIEKAAQLDANDLRILGEALHEAIDPDGTLADDEDIERRRGVSYRDHHDGTHSLTWRDRPEAIALAKAAVGALDKPNKHHDAAPAPSLAEAVADPRSATQRRADALKRIFGGLLDHGHLPNSRGRAPHLHLTVSLDALKGLTAAAKSALATGGALSSEAVRRFACDAEITPIVLDARGKPLSVGRRFRTWTAAIWDALVARDTGCAFPACTVPAAWCRGHHVKHWADQGPTSLENGVLLCDSHHVAVHHRGWVVRLDEHGIPEFIPPPWMDSSGEPRRNDHWRLQRDLLHPPDLPSP